MSSVLHRSTVLVVVLALVVACGDASGDTESGVEADSAANSADAPTTLDAGEKENESDGPATSSGGDSLCNAIRQVDMDELFAPVEFGELEDLSNGGCLVHMENLEDLVGDDFPLRQSTFDFVIVPLSPNEYDATTEGIDNLVEVDGLGQAAYRIEGGTTIGVLVDEETGFTVTSMFEVLLPLAESFETDLPDRQQVDEGIFRVGEVMVSYLGG